MQIIEAIDKVDELKPNAYSQAEKIGWLSDLDGMIKRNVIDTHEGGDLVNFWGYDEDTPLETSLLVGAPYEEIYTLWLESKIDYHNREYASYNNTTIRFNDIYSQFEMDYNRNNRPLSRKYRYF